MKMPSVEFTRSQIAPCGINCGTCIAFLRERNKCPGCLTPSGEKPKTRVLCEIKTCEQLRNTTSGYCFDCSSFPCKRLKHIDKRYTIRYNTSLLQNLISIKETGIEAFLKNEVRRWTCPGCGSVLSVHKSSCIRCNFSRVEGTS